MRLIDADALKAEIQRRRERYKTLTGVDMAMLIDDAPTVGGWISVADKLPNDNKPVYVWLGRGSELRSEIPFVGKYDPFRSGAWWIWGLDSDHRDNIKVTHWMPLPEPPEEEQKNEDH